MSVVVGVNTTKVDAGTGGANWVDQGRIKSGLKIMSDSYEAVALANPSTIKVANLPAGAVIQDVAIYFDALGAGVTVTVGDSNDADRYIASTITTSAGAASSGLVDGIGYEIGSNSGDTAVLVTTGVGAATGTIKVVIYYTN